MKLLHALVVAGSIVAATTSGPASAGIFRAYLSVAGSDANPCTLPQPCRLLPAALAAVNDGGEIWMLDSANFNTATVPIAKSVTILAVPGALGSVVANGGDALAIAAPLAKVTLRNLVILNLAGSTNTGVNFTQGSALTIEGCELYGMNFGVRATTSATLTIKDSTIRDNASGGIVTAAPLKASVRNSSVLNNGFGLVASAGASLTVSNSAIVGSTVGVDVNSSGGAATFVAIAGTSVSGNSTGFRLTTTTGGDSAQVLLNGATVAQNGTGVLFNGATAVVSTRQNNTFKFNSVDVSGGTLTTLAAR